MKKLLSPLELIAKRTESAIKLQPVINGFVHFEALFCVYPQIENSRNGEAIKQQLDAIFSALLNQLSDFIFHQNGFGYWNGYRYYRAPLKRFRYGLDPLCLGAILLYSLNRWLFDFAALRGWFNDVLLIPAAAPLFLWVERKLGLRKKDANPTWGELAFLFVTWSLAAEILAPTLFSHCTADPLDVVAYAAGGIASAFWWNPPSRKPRVQPE